MAPMIIIVPCVSFTFLCKYPKITPPPANKMGKNKMEIPEKTQPKIAKTDPPCVFAASPSSECPHVGQNFASTAHSSPHPLQKITICPPSPLSYILCGTFQDIQIGISANLSAWCLSVIIGTSFYH